MNGLDLFSGIGGIAYGLREWVTPIAYCEVEPYAQAVLIQRMAEGKLTQAPIWDDVTTLRGEDLPSIDIITAGFPCQDISVAGHGKGLEGERSGLFFEVCRLVKETNPTFVFLENVPAIRTRGLREVIRALTDLGYDSRWSRISASEIGANHQRERWFLLAHSNSSKIRDFKQRLSEGWSQGVSNEGEAQSGLHGKDGQVAESESKRVQGLRASGFQESQAHEGSLLPVCSSEEPAASHWQIEPSVGRVADGIPFRVDRVKALGNAVVPQQVEEAFKRLVGL